MILSWCARIHAAIKWTPVCRKKINLVTILVLFIPLSRLRHLLQTKSLIASCSDKAEGENHNLVSLSPCLGRSELIELYNIDFIRHDSCNYVTVNKEHYIDWILFNLWIPPQSSQSANCNNHSHVNLIPLLFCFWFPYQNSLFWWLLSCKIPNNNFHIFLWKKKFFKSICMYPMIWNQLLKPMFALLNQ